jgi:hypothetical protein
MIRFIAGIIADGFFLPVVGHFEMNIAWNGPIDVLYDSTFVNILIAASLIGGVPYSGGQNGRS